MKKLIAICLLAFPGLAYGQSPSDCMGVGLPDFQASLLCSATRTITGDYTVDASGDIILDADGGQVYIKDGGTTLQTFESGKQIYATTGEIETTGDFTVDASGNIVLDSGLGQVRISNAGSIKALLQTGTSYNYYFPNSSDGADAYIVSMSGGGTNAATRGGFVNLYGNESSANPGDIIMTTGDNADGDITMTATDDIDIDAGTSGELNLKVAGATIMQVVSNQVGLGTGKEINASVGKLRLPQGTTLPATCNVGNLFHDTDSDDCADTGAGDGALCICKTTDTWALISDF